MSYRDEYLARFERQRAGNTWPGQMEAPSGVQYSDLGQDLCVNVNGLLMECPIPPAHLREMTEAQIAEKLKDYGYNPGIVTTGWSREVFLYPEFARPISAQSFRTSSAVVAVGTDWTAIAEIKTCQYEVARLLAIAGIASSGNAVDLTWRLKWRGGNDESGGARSGTAVRQNENIAEMVGDVGSLTRPERLIGLVGSTSRLVLEAKRSGAAQNARGLLIGWKASIQGGGPVISGSVPV